MKSIVVGGPIARLLALVAGFVLLLPSNPIVGAGASATTTSSSSSSQPRQQQQVAPGKHTSNYALIVSSSRYWFNYRHVVNALGIYQLLKDGGGYDDSHIILMLADDLPTNPRNPLKNRMYKDAMAHDEHGTIFGADTEIDYRGEDVTVESMNRALLGLSTGAASSSSSPSSFDELDADSNLLIYWTGHGGDQFFKFQDVEEITAVDIANLFDTMHTRQKYKSILFIADTCQAFTLGDKITAPNVYFIGSSLRGENSYAYGGAHPRVGLAVIEKYTQRILDFIEKRQYLNSNKSNSRPQAKTPLTLQQALVDHLSFEQQRAHVGVKESRCDRPMHQVPLSDFFVNVQAPQHGTAAPPLALSSSSSYRRQGSAPRFQFLNQDLPSNGTLHHYSIFDEDEVTLAVSTSRPAQTRNAEERTTTRQSIDGTAQRQKLLLFLLFVASLVSGLLFL